MGLETMTMAGKRRSDNDNDNGYDVVDEVLARDAIGEECDLSRNRQWLFDHYFHEVFEKGIDNSNSNLVLRCFSRGFTHRFKDFNVEDVCDYAEFEVHVQFEYLNSENSYSECLYTAKIDPKWLHGDMLSMLRNNLMSYEVSNWFEEAVPAENLGGFTEKSAEEAVMKAVAYGIRALENIRRHFEKCSKKKAFILR